MKKILLYLIAILTPFMFISTAFALESFSSFPKVLNPDSLGNYNLSQFTNYSYLFWVNGTGVSSYAQKWSYQYDTNGKVSSDKTYSVSTIAYINPTQVDSADNVSGVGSPVVLLNGQACTVQTQTIRAMWEEYVNNSVQGSGVDWQPYDLDGLFYSVICENIMIKDNTSYLDFFFPNSNRMRHFNVSYLQFTETSGNSVEQAIQENNQALDIMNKQMQDNWVKQDEIKQEQQKTNDALTSDSDDESSSSCGMICKLKNILSYINPLSEKFFAYKLVELLIEALKSLIVPDDMSFVTDFVDALESKLGFIGAIPGQIIEFAINLVSASWSEFNSISFPSISIFGYNFWDSQEIDLTEAINIFKPFKYVTDCICVVLCARTLNKWREQFTGGSSE